MTPALLETRGLRTHFRRGSWLAPTAVRAVDGAGNVSYER